MPTQHYGFDANKGLRSPLTHNEINWLFRVVDSQLNGALSMLGRGVLIDFLPDGTPDPDAANLAVTLANGALQVAGGRAITREDAQGYGWMMLFRQFSTTVPTVQLTNGANYIFLVPRLADWADEDAASLLDSRAGSDALIEVRDDDAEEGGDGAVLLAQVTLSGGAVTAVVDRRPLSLLPDLVKRMGRVESDLGYDADARAKGSADARLSALESPPPADGSGSTSVAIRFLSQLLYSATDARSAIEVLTEMLAALKAELLLAIATGGVKPQTTPIDLLFHELAIIRQEVGKQALLIDFLVQQLAGASAFPLPLGMFAGKIEQPLERSQSANVVGTKVAGTPVYGAGAPQFPDYLGPTTLTPQADGSLEP